MSKKHVCLSDSWIVLERKSPKARRMFFRTYNRNTHQ